MNESEGLLPKMGAEITSLLADKKKIFIAYSGGVDSHVLLHLLVQIREEIPKLRLTAVHINHGLSINAKKWEKHCLQTCKDLNVPCIVKNVDAKSKIVDYSPEEVARNLRYKVFAEILPHDALLVTAHQANDQAETLLLQLFRGAGPRGLAAMPIIMQFAKGWLLRPLLSFSRDELLSYAAEYKLKWLEDESNTNVKFARNLLRQRLIPLIKKNWPGIVIALNRVANHCAAANELLEDLAVEDLEKVSGGNKDTINTQELKKLTLARQSNVLRFWLYNLKLPIPSTAKVQEIIRTVVHARNDAMPIVKWRGAEVRRFQNHLYAMVPLLVHNNKVVLRFYLRRPLKLPGELGVLHAKTSEKFKANYKNKIFTVRFRQGGEELKLGTRNTHKLKKLMQEWQIPPWLRERVPLICCNKRIVAVVGYYNIDGIQPYIVN